MFINSLFLFVIPAVLRRESSVFKRLCIPGFLREKAFCSILKTMKKPSKKNTAKSKTDKVRSSAYGEKVTICANTGCALRKKAKCFGFEGCPGFKAK
jgi:hypothetical protein